jgi:hypothetical protein
LAAFFSLAFAFFNAFFSFLTAGTGVVVRLCFAASLIVETSWGSVVSMTEVDSAGVGFFFFFD